jgi:hypothetical protein
MISPEDSKLAKQLLEMVKLFVINKCTLKNPDNKVYEKSPFYIKYCFFEPNKKEALSIVLNKSFEKVETKKIVFFALRKGSKHEWELEWFRKGKWINKFISMYNEFSKEMTNSTGPFSDIDDDIYLK